MIDVTWNEEVRLKAMKTRWASVAVVVFALLLVTCAPAPSPPAAAAPPPAQQSAIRNYKADFPIDGRVRFAGSIDVPKTFSFSLVPVDPEHQSASVRGQDGVFETRVWDEGQYQAEGIWVDGIELLESFPAAVTRQGVEVVMIPPRAARVRLVDASTGEAILGGLAYPDDRGWFRRSSWADRPPQMSSLPNVYMLRDQPIRVDANDLLDLGVGSGARLFYVRAPGYAWRAVNVPYVGGAPLAFALHPSGSLRLRFEGGAKDVAYMVSLDGEKFLDTNWRDFDGERGALIDHLPAGSFDVTLYSSSVGREARQLPVGHATIRGGQETALEFDAPTLDPADRTISGLVVCDSTWGPSSPEWLELIGADRDTKGVHVYLARTIHEDHAPERTRSPSSALRLLCEATAGHSQSRLDLDDLSSFRRGLSSRGMAAASVQLLGLAKLVVTACATLTNSPG